MKQSREFEKAHARTEAAEALAAAIAERASNSTKLYILRISDPSSQFTVIPSRRQRLDTVQQIRVYHAENQQPSVRHSTSKTDNTDIGEGHSSHDCNEEMHPGVGDVHGADTAFGSMTCGDIAPRYLEDGPTWSFDTYGGNGDSDDGIDGEPALGSDNGEFLGRRMMEEFGDENDASGSPSSTPVQYTPTSGSDHDSVLEEDQGIEFRTPPRRAGLAHSEPSEISFEQALSIFNLDNYISVDMGILQERLQVALSWESFDCIVIANAFPTIVKHQDKTGSWTVCLGWDPNSDALLLNDHLVTHHDDWRKTKTSSRLRKKTADSAGQSSSQKTGSQSRSASVLPLVKQAVAAALRRYGHSIWTKSS